MLPPGHEIIIPLKWKMRLPFGHLRLLLALGKQTEKGGQSVGPMTDLEAQGSYDCYYTLRWPGRVWEDPGEHLGCHALSKGEQKKLLSYSEPCQGFKLLRNKGWIHSFGLNTSASEILPEGRRTRTGG